MEKSPSYQERARIRKGRTPEFYRNFVEAFASSGLGVLHYCQKHQVGLETFRKYQSLLKDKPALEKKKSTSPTLVRVLPAPQVDLHLEGGFEIQFQGGALLRLPYLDGSLLQLLGPLLRGHAL